jgi:putative ABC transport system substrate-binding protein
MRERFFGLTLSPLPFALSLVSALLFALGGSATAQQPKKVSRIGFLGNSSASAYSGFIDAFRKGLRELGYVEGQNIAIEYRYGDGKRDRLSDLSADLIRLKVDVIVVSGSLAIGA